LDEKSHTSWSEYGGHSNGGFQSHHEDDKNKDSSSLDNLNDPSKSQLSELHMVVMASTHGENLEELDSIENSSSEANRATDTETSKDKVKYWGPMPCINVDRTFLSCEMCVCVCIHTQCKTSEVSQAWKKRTVKYAVSSNL
jgi:hypothetical protein